MRLSLYYVFYLYLYYFRIVLDSDLYSNFAINVPEYKYPVKSRVIGFFSLNNT